MVFVATDRPFSPPSPPACANIGRPEKQPLRLTAGRSPENLVRSDLFFPSSLRLRACVPTCACALFGVWCQNCFPSSPPPPYPGGVFISCSVRTIRFSVSIRAFRETTTTPGPCFSAVPISDNLSDPFWWCRRVWQMAKKSCLGLSAIDCLAECDTSV